MVDKSTVNYGSVILFNILHALSFSVNLLSINTIILQLKYIITFDISMVIFQKKITDRRLEIGTWRNGLWYLDHEGMNSALIYMIERVGVRGSEMITEKVLILDYQRDEASFL
jgi:hypothetical protein